MNISLKNNYTAYSNKLPNLIKYTKYKFEQNKINSFKNDSKKVWQFVKNKIGTKSKKTTTITSIKTDNNIIKNALEIANYFNTFFNKIGTNLSNSLDPPITIYPLNLIKRNQESIFITPTNPIEVYTTINKLKNKSGGIDGINAKVLKILISTSLANIFNMVFEPGIYPDCFKEAEIITVYKAGAKNILNNYRPIALISNLAKVFLHKRILIFMNKHNLLSKFQFGFRPNIETNNALAHVSDLLHNKLDKSLPTIGVFLDLAKAFDVVDFDVLLSKLEIYGIRGMPLTLFKNYLCNRKQLVRINNSRSGILQPRTGVPQGFILVPFLFLIYLNDVFNTLPENSLIAYADDTILLSSAPTWELVTKLVNKQLSKQYHWLYLNKLSLNIRTSVFQAFGDYCNSVPSTVNLMIKNNQLKRVFSCKYLGIIIDSRLKWHEHISNIVKKTKYLIFIFAKLNKILTYKLLMAVYYGLFNSIANYGNIAWGSAYKTTLTPLINIQDKILKIIANNHSRPPLNIYHSYVLNCFTQNHNNLCQSYKKIPKSSRKKSLPLPKCKLAFGQKNYKYTEVKNLNRLPLFLKNSLTFKGLDTI